MADSFSLALSSSLESCARKDSDLEQSRMGCRVLFSRIFSFRSNRSQRLGVTVTHCPAANHTICRGEEARMTKIARGVPKAGLQVAHSIATVLYSTRSGFAGELSRVGAPKSVQRRGFPIGCWLKQEGALTLKYCSVHSLHDFRSVTVLSTICLPIPTDVVSQLTT